MNYFSPNIITFSDYYPFGMEIEALSANNSDYRYGFQGQEKDNEVKGNGNSVNYKFRMHDPRLGRFFAVDPLSAKYPHYTPYSFSGNKVIHAIELEGLEEKIIIREIKSNGRIKKISYISIQNTNNIIDDNNHGTIIYNIFLPKYPKKQRDNFINLAYKFAGLSQLNFSDKMKLINNDAFKPIYDKDNSTLVKGELNYLNQNTKEIPIHGHIPIDRKVYFEHDDATLDWDYSTNQSEESVMQPKRADYILATENSDYTIVLEGHTSSTGDADYNYNLAKKRINTVKADLVSRGADPSKIVTSIIGESMHKDKDSNDDGTHSESNESSEAENRSVTVRMLYK